MWKQPTGMGFFVLVEEPICPPPRPGVDLNDGSIASNMACPGIRSSAASPHPQKFLESKSVRRRAIQAFCIQDL
jgi:hypothetical protein